MASALLLALIALVSLLAPLVVHHSPTAIDLDALTRPPSGSHWLGTDASGRDVLARVLYGGRVSLAVGLTAAALSVAVGAVLGAAAGLLGGWADGVVMRAADLMLSFPTIMVIIVLAGVLGPSVPMLVVAIALTHWPASARLVRGVALELRDREYVLASRLAGASRSWLVRVHILPAALPPVTVAATLAVAQAVLLEATLSFLGLGVQPPQASWGNMLNDAQSLTLIQTAPWLWLPPGLAIAVTVLAVSFVGDGLRDAVDPQQGRVGA